MRRSTSVDPVESVSIHGIYCMDTPKTVDLNDEAMLFDHPFPLSLPTQARRTAQPRPGRRNALIAVCLSIGAQATFAANPVIANRETVPAPPQAALPAFPGAEGFGATTPGGRGGRVLLVTNLNDSGPGSLRAACAASGPRIVVFGIGGLIKLQSDLVVLNPYLTVAGQTAPGDGICLRDHPFIVATHDVVVRYLRSRLGDESRRQSDCIDLANGAHDAILDHCSATWSVDEALSLSGNVSNVTVQWCLIGESLNESIHRKGEHGYGSLARANGPVSLHHNLWIHNLSRNPRLGDNYGKPPYPTFDVRNNVIYDYGKVCTGLTQGRLRVNYVANYIRPGPATTGSHPISVGLPSELRFFIRGNVLEGNKTLTADNSHFFSRMTASDGSRVVGTVEEPFEAPRVQTQTAGEAFEAVLASVGASLPVRDVVDARLVEDVRNRTGRLINSQTDVGGWPNYKSGEAPRDSDNDGMPDAWETAHGLDPLDPADSAQGGKADGYTHIEDYLHSLTNPSTS